MSPVTTIPTTLARRHEAARNPRNAATCGLFDIAGRLGLAHRSDRTICATLDAYVAKAGFPAPFPIVRKGTLVARAHRDSRWPLVAVDAWFDNRLPPAAREAMDRIERAEIDTRLDARAGRLFADDAA